MNLDKIVEKYGYQGEIFKNAIKHEIEFFEKRKWVWDVKIIRNDFRTLIVALICKDGVSFYTFSKAHGFYVGCFTLSAMMMEEFVEKAEQMWEDELKCLESNSV